MEPRRRKPPRYARPPLIRPRFARSPSPARGEGPRPPNSLTRANSPMSGHSMRQGFRRREIVSKKEKAAAASKKRSANAGRRIPRLVIAGDNEAVQTKRRAPPSTGGVAGKGRIYGIRIASMPLGMVGDNMTRAEGRRKGEIARSSLKPKSRAAASWACQPRSPCSPGWAT